MGKTNFAVPGQEALEGRFINKSFARRSQGMKNTIAVRRHFFFYERVKAKI